MAKMSSTEERRNERARAAGWSSRAQERSARALGYTTPADYRQAKQEAHATRKGALPFAPFEEFARRALPGRTDLEIEVSAGVSRRSMSRWRGIGEIPFSAADTAACRLGVHPAYIWRGEYWERLLEVCAADEERQARNPAQWQERNRRAAMRQA